MSSQTEIFRRRVTDIPGTPPPTAPVTVTLGEAVACLRETRASGLVLLDGDGRPAGLMTEADVARRVAFAAESDAPVAAAMTSPVITVRDDAPLYRGIARMRRHVLRHLPVVDGEGRLCGMLHLDDALALASEDLVRRIDRLSPDGDAAALRAAKGAQAEAAADLLADKVPATDVLGLITQVNNDIYRRATETALAGMDTPPPVPFALIVMGSGGRGENYLHPDQDNGLILANYPDGEHTRIDGWFVAFAERLTARMDAVGMPYCNGYVMATNPLWRKTRTQWLDQLAIWVRRRNMAALMYADIFFDFVPVAGDEGLARPVRERITETMSDARLFLNGMHQQHETLGSALGLFGRFRTAPAGSGHAGAIEIKKTAILPVVGAIRLLALDAGMPATGTLERVRALAAANVLRPDDAEDIAAAFAIVCDLLLRAQIDAFESGRPVTNHVTVSSLRRAQKRDLRAALRTVETLNLRARAEFTGRMI